jgi:hypothetical protein
MRRIAAFLFAAVISVPGSANAAEGLGTFQKLYFSSTKPGSWAKYEQTSTDRKGKKTVTEMTLSRLDDEGGKTWFEMHIVPKSDTNAKPTTMKYLLSPDFPVEKNALDFTKYIERVILQQDGKKAQEMPWQQVRAMLGASLGYVDYGGSVERKGTDTAGGKTCDRYTMKGPFELKILFMRIKGSAESDICLNESVPFGRVTEHTITNDEDGKLMSTSDLRLVDSGGGAKSRITGPIEKAPDVPDFGKAFQSQ